MKIDALSPGEPTAGGSEGMKKERPARFGRLTHRDRQLMGLLATARYFTTEQLGRLFFIGRHPETARKRLAALAAHGAGRHAVQYLRRLQYQTFEGTIVTVWALTPVGYAIAERATGITFKVPRTDVSAAFLEHAVTLNDLLVGLLEAELVKKLANAKVVADAAKNPPRDFERRKANIYASARLPGFRWSAAETVRLPWTEYDMKAAVSRDRAIVPDALLEIPSHRLRLFLECEMGTHSIQAKSDEKQGATVAKVERYESFIRGFADSHARQTFYARTYPDGFRAEVLFLVQNEGRKAAVNNALKTWRLGRGDNTVAARAVTASELREIVTGSTAAPMKEKQRRAKELAPEELELLFAFVDGTIRRLKEVRALARARKEQVPSYPSRTDEMLALVSHLAAND